MSIITDRYGKRAPENADGNLRSLCLLKTERHPWAPFIPAGAKVLMLGSFPPKENRWSMNFFYPNFNNDMWRIIGLVFFGDRDHFISMPEKKFNKDMITDFCRKYGLALYDTAYEVRRLKDNASDKFLEIVTAADIPAMLHDMPRCNAIITTGEKASETVAAQFGCPVPKTGEHIGLTLHAGSYPLSGTPLSTGGPAADDMYADRHIEFYRLPSSSRAYPLSLERKAEAYSILTTLLEGDRP